MALIQCPECGKTISNRAAYCPECGHPIKNNNKRKIVIFSIVIAITAVIAVGGFFLLDNSNKAAGKSEEIQIQITPKFSEAIRQYDELTPFSEGMAAVRKGNKWGYINHEGTLVIPCKYSIKPGRFSEGLACVEAPVKPAVQFINKNGEIVLKGNFYYGVEFEGAAKDTLQLPCFNNGVCAVWASYMTGKEAQTFFIDKKGTTVSNANYAIVSNTDNHGLVRFIQDEEVGYKSPDGTIPIPAKYSYLSDFSDGIALAKISSKDNEGYYADDITIYGYVDLNGNSTFSQQDFDKIAKIIETKTIERNRENKEREEQKRFEEQRIEEQRRLGSEINVSIHYNKGSDGFVKYSSVSSSHGHYFDQPEKYRSLLGNIDSKILVVPEGKKWIFKNIERNGCEGLILVLDSNGKYIDKKIEVRPSTHETYTFYGGQKLAVRIWGFWDDGGATFHFIEKSEYD